MKATEFYKGRYGHHTSDEDVKTICNMNTFASHLLHECVISQIENMVKYLEQTDYKNEKGFKILNKCLFKLKNNA